MDFCSLIFSEENGLCAIDEPLPKNYYKESLNNYYISSSHNTYLMGNQVTYPVDILGYINAIKMGCRCFEIECHDSKDNSLINVYHGYAFTSSLNFRGIYLYLFIFINIY